jgi:Fic family protein
MRRRGFHGGRVGRYDQTAVGGEVVRAYIPPPLPPIPPLDLIPLLGAVGRAERALGRLDGITVILPAHQLFLYMYVRKEAVLSSQIEGTQSTLTDLLQFENAGEAGPSLDDVREVSNYVDAMFFGLERMREIPISRRLVQEMHSRLLQSGRGAEKDPGQFRRTQNWIGGTRPGNALFVPPPVHEIDALFGQLEMFLHEEQSGIPPLIKAGLLHVQFETIHPFLDGNGRIGRLLITLYLCFHNVLSEPLLYLSLYLKTHRNRYYELLQVVREQGAWEDWLSFFLQGVAETANQAFEAANHIVALFQSDRERITAESKRASSALRIHEAMQSNPFVTANQLVTRTGLAMPTVNSALADLVGLGIASEMTGKRRGRVFGYTAYLAILNEGTNPLPR